MLSYTKHKWIYQNKGHSICFVCGITEMKWNKKIQNDSMINWDCAAVRAKDLLTRGVKS